MNDHWRVWLTWGVPLAAGFLVPRWVAYALLGEGAALLWSVGYLVFLWVLFWHEWRRL